MKICYLADSESIHTKRWCNHFSQLGYEIHLISFKQNCDIENINFHPIDSGRINVGGGNWKVLLKTKSIKRLISTIKPDILHSHYATSYGIVGSLLNFHPFVITALGSDVLISPKKSVVYRKLLKYAFSKADWITTMAEHMKKAALSIGNFEEKTTVLPFGIDVSLFNSTNRKIVSNRFILTSTRNFEDVYNLPHLIKAVNIIKDKIPNLELHLIGDGSKRQEVEGLVSDLGLNDLTTFHGKIPQPKMVELLNKSQLFVSVSLSDGNNISLNEAMACGCFPIATNIEANTQWITNNENGFLVEIDDVEKLASLILNSYENYSELSSNAFEINQKIIKEKADWNLNIKIVENKYLELVNGK